MIYIRKSLLSFIVCIVSALSLLHCGRTDQARESGNEETEAASTAASATAQEEAQEVEGDVQVDFDSVNAESGFNVEQLAEEPQLAIEVEITANGVRPVGTPSIVMAPRRSDSSLPDLRVLASSEGSVLAEYTIEDPRFSEIEGEGVREAPSARTFIHVPFSADLDRIEVVPLTNPASVQGFETVVGEDGKAHEAEVSKGGRFDPGPLLDRACQGKTEIEECKKILENQ